MLLEPALVIGGGVGPMAGVVLHVKIIENTVTDGTDQSHLSVYHFSCSEFVPDRTEYLLDIASGGAGRADPAMGMAGVFEAAYRALAGRPAIGGIPCNTFHAPAIFDRFLARMGSACPDIRVVDMLAETVGLVNYRLGRPPDAIGRGELVGVLSTTGTRRAGMYDELLRRNGYGALHVSEAEQAVLHEAIYDRSWGLKAVSPPSARATGTVASLASVLAANGAVAIILACTELPLALGGPTTAGIPLVDPMLALARAMIREAAPSRLAPLS